MNLKLKLAQGLVFSSLLIGVSAPLVGQTPLPVTLQEIQKIPLNPDSPSELKKHYETLKVYLEANPQDYDTRIKAAEVIYCLASQTNEKTEKKSYLEQGIVWTAEAIKLSPNLAAGHYHHGVLIGLKAEMSGVLTGLKSKDLIKNEMLAVLAIDERFSGGDAHLVLGEWFRDVPKLMGGSLEESQAHLTKALEINPKNRHIHLAFAELYLKQGNQERAKKSLEAFLAGDKTGEHRFEAARDATAVQKIREGL